MVIKSNLTTLDIGGDNSSSDGGLGIGQPPHTNSGSK